MTRVTYGVTSSSFHSIQLLLELARTAPEKVRRIIENDMYVDDLLTGCSNLEEAKDPQDQLKNFTDRRLPFTEVDMQQS